MKRVLFLCIGNSCRSQMAEGFARRYGSDVMEPESAGLAPAPIIQLLTKRVMEAKNIKIDDQFPKHIESVDLGSFHTIVNLSGFRVPFLPADADVRNWQVEDPVGRDEEFFLQIRDQIESLVMHLILEFRRESKGARSSSSRPIRLRSHRIS